MSGKLFKHCLLLIWAVFDAGYVARVILPNRVFDQFFFLVVADLETAFRSIPGEPECCRCPWQGSS